MTPLEPRFELPIIYFFAIVEEMMERRYLGEFELMILLGLMRLGEDAYGVSIARELEMQTERDVSIGSIYAALERLEGKGLIVSSLGEPTAERGGKAKRYFRVTHEGIRQVKETKRVLSAMWGRLPKLKEKRS